MDALETTTQFSMENSLNQKFQLILFKSSGVIPIYTVIELFYKHLNQMGPNAGRASC